MFIPEEFESAKNYVKEGNFDSSYVRFINYYKKPTCLLVEDEKIGFMGYISFIVKSHVPYGIGASPVIIDQTRRVKSGRYHIFNIEKIKMHHYSYIRKDEKSLRRKLNNTSFKQHSKMIQHIDDVVNCYLNYNDGLKVFLPWMSGIKEWEIKKVEDKLKLGLDF